MSNKITKREMFKVVNTIIPDDFSTTFERPTGAMVDITAEDIRKFIARELELLNRKSSGERKPTKTDIANMGFQESIINGLEEGKLYTISEIIKIVPECNSLSNQKVTSLLKQMMNAGTAEKVVEKGRALFRVVAED